MGQDIAEIPGKNSTSPWKIHRSLAIDDVWVDNFNQ